MVKSQIIQIGIIITIFIVIFSTYKYLSKTKNNSNIIKKSETNILTAEKNDEKFEKNIISELSYKSLDDNGNLYEINSASGTIQGEDENSLLLQTVEAKIVIINYGTVYILSDNALYNKVSLDTHFYKNVNLKYHYHDIKSDDLFLRYSEKKVKISNNVHYKNQDSELMADEIKMNLLTKVSKIYMTNKKKKVKAIINN